MISSRLPGQLLLLALAAIPLAAVLTGSVVDVGPDGGPRATAVHLGLATADPTVRESARNSLIAAGVGTFLAMGLGTTLGHALGRWSFWGRKPLALAIFSGLAISPLIASLGCRELVDACARLAATPSDRASIGGWGSSIAWVLAVGLAGAPWIALAVRDALGDVNLPAFEAAAQRGMGRRQASRRLIWPLIRPSAAVAAAGVFARAVGDPGPPLILGLRRSLAFQAYDSLRIPEGLPRASVLGALALAMAVVGSVLLRWWGGTDWLAEDAHGDPARRSPTMRWPSAGMRIAGLMAGALLILVPMIGLGLDAARANGQQSFDHPAGWVDPDGSALALRVFAGAVIVGLGLLLLVAWSGIDSTSRAGLHPRSLARVLIAAGPLPIVLGVAVLQAEGPSWLLGMGWKLAPNPAGRSTMAGLDPAILVATLAALLPMAIAWTVAPPASAADKASRRSRIDAARLSGLSASKARGLARLIAPRSIALPGWIFGMAMAATTVATILIPPATSTPPTLPAAIAREADRPPAEAGPILPAIAIAIALAGLAIASGSHPARLGKLARQGIGPV